MSEFDEIRPYNDDEAGRVVERLLSDNEFIDSMTQLKLGGIGRYLAPFVRGRTRARLIKEFGGIRSVAEFQANIENYIADVLKKTVDRLSVAGLENLDRSRSHLFISNHRDIAMDPAFVNWTLFQNGFTTLRIAIGDNLLTKPYASDLMRLNKSFIVNRSAKKPREKFKAAKLLSKYIHHSVVNDNENVWIAQREGRAKDGIDVTNPAIISMLGLNKPKMQAFGDYIKELMIVPVSISYEYDPCDLAKARELTEKELHGEYQKTQHEDVNSIAMGITGYKGRVHLAFGEPFGAEFENNEEFIKTLNERIHKNYVLHPTNGFAYEQLEKKSPSVEIGEEKTPFNQMSLDQERQKFIERVSKCPSKYRDAFLRGYANPVKKKLNP